MMLLLLGPRQRPCVNLGELKVGVGHAHFAAVIVGVVVGASAAVVASLLSCLPQYHQVVEPIACTRTGLCKHGEYTEFY